MSVLGAVAVCPRCRLVRPGVGACDDGERALDLDVAAQRELLTEQVWGDERARAAVLTGARRSARRRVVGAVLGPPPPARSAPRWSGCRRGCQRSGRCSAAPPAASAPIGAIPACIHAAPSPSRRRRGSALAASSPPSRSSRRRAGPGARRGRSSCYHGRWGARTMLRVGVAGRLELALDGGDRIRVPAGPLWIDGGHDRTELARPELEELLRAVDPARVLVAELWSPLPFNVVAEATVQVGDRVELAGALDRALDPSVGGGRLPYRAAPDTYLTPAGMLTLRRRDG
ncbi:MAG: hypothetical protein R2939_05575 [Kofleriaceae bacterium]